MLALSSEVQTYIDQSLANAIAHRLPAERETYFTVKEVAATLHVHPDTVLRLIHSGALRSVGKGKLLRVPQSAIDDYFSPRSAAKIVRGARHAAA
jgi:excisionase family DNA binding protein